jgi:hypothetical protein
MSKAYTYLCIAVVTTVAACSTIDSDVMYDPKEPVAAINVLTFGNVDPSNRTIALPPGGDDLLLALKIAFSNDGWAVSVGPGSARYVMFIETTVWKHGGRLASINLSIVDQKTGIEILTAVRKAYTSFDNPIDINAVAETLIDCLKKITSPFPDKAEPPSS